MNALILSTCMIACGLVNNSAAPEEKELPPQIDQNYLVLGIECAITEMKFAETALDQSQSKEVKTLAQTIKDDHNACLEKLMVQAKKEKLGVVEGLNKENKEAAKQLSELKGNEFDLEYVRGVIERHEKMMKCCDDQIKSGKVAEITTLCEDSKAAIKEHLVAARKVQVNLKK